MTLLAVADAARLLGIHPRTLQQWLQLAHMPFHPHPSDGRIKGLTLEQVQQLALVHNRSLQQEPPLHSDPAPAAVSAVPTPLLGSLDTEPALSGDLITHFASLERQMVQLAEQMAHLTQAIGSLSPQASRATTPTLGAGLTPRPQSLPASAQAFGSAGATPPQGAKAPTPRPPHPGEVCSSSLRPLPLIEYGAAGRYIVICPQEGELALVPDSPEWFGWLATLSSFRFVGRCGRFTAYRNGTRRSPKRSWSAYRCIHQRGYKHTLGTTDCLSIARMEELAAKLAAHLTAP